MLAEPGRMTACGTRCTPDHPASPNETYAALVAAAGYVPVALTGEDYIELLPADWRSIGRLAASRSTTAPTTAPSWRPTGGCHSGVRRQGRPVGSPPRPIRSLPRLGARPPPRRLDHRPVDPPAPWSPSRSRTSPGGTPARSPPSAGSTTPTRQRSRWCSPRCCGGHSTVPAASVPWAGPGPPPRCQPGCPWPCRPRRRARRRAAGRPGPGAG